jgi:hypothetical protein
VVVSGGFRAKVSGENFSLWQLGLILSALQDLASGFVRIGGCKARGMGTVRLRDWSVDLGFLNRDFGRITGSRPSAPNNNPYQLIQDDELPAPSRGAESERGLFRILRYDGKEAVEGLSSALIADPLRRYLERKP